MIQTPELWVVVTCMGRLEFLRQTAPLILANAQVGYCLVDYSCPDESGKWLASTHADAAQGGRLVIEKVAGRSIFNKCEALNAGARRAILEGARYLCFLDADTLVQDGFFDWVSARTDPQKFMIVAQQDGKDVPSLTGALVISTAAFARTRGFDEQFRGWGAEDLEFRLRLHLLHRLGYEDIPLGLVQPLHHDDALRSRFYEEKNPMASNANNFGRLHQKMDRWRLLQWYQPATAERLFYS